MNAKHEWLPMEAAPRDGSRFLAVVDGLVRVVSYGKASADGDGFQGACVDFQHRC